MKKILVGASTVLLATLWLLLGKPFPARHIFWSDDQPRGILLQPDIKVSGCGEEEDNRGEQGKISKNRRVLFVGDTGFGESYQRWMPQVDGVNFLDAMGYDYSLEKLTPLLHQADLVIANLETPIADLSVSPLSGQKKYIHRGDIHKTPETLHRHNIFAVSLANNHTLDYGVEGLRQTLKALEENGIAWFGAGLSEPQAFKPLYSELTIGGNSFQLVVVAGFEYRWNYRMAYKFYAGGEAGGVNCWTRKKAATQLRAIRAENRHAFIVAFPHWGRNYRFKTREQKKLAHALIDAGADLVIGHGAHIVQEIESYRGRWILYSLGNFVFNSPGRYQKENAHPFSLAARLDVCRMENRFVLRLRLYPIFSDNLVTNYQPRLVTEEERNRVQRILLERSPNPRRLRWELGVGEDEVGHFLTLNVGVLDNSH